MVAESTYCFFLGVLWTTVVYKIGLEGLKISIRHLSNELFMPDTKDWILDAVIHRRLIHN